MQKSMKRVNQKKRKRLIFYICGISLPIIQVLIFYFYVNYEAIALAFQKYVIDVDTGAAGYIWVGLENFEKVINDFATNDYLVTGIFRGASLYLVSIVLMMTSYFVAYYIARGFRFGQVFFVCLMLPSMLSSMCNTAINKYFLCDFIPALWQKITGQQIPSLLDLGDQSATYIVLFCNMVIAGFCGNILVNVATLKGINKEVLEAGQIDGVTPLQEFFKIELPMVWPVLSTFWIMGLGGFWTGDIGLYGFYGQNAPTGTYTLGYYLTRLTQQGTLSTYPYVAALGLLISLATIPLVIFGRWASKKLGNNDD